MISHITEGFLQFSLAFMSFDIVGLLGRLDAHPKKLAEQCGTGGVWPELKCGTISP